MEVYLMGRTSRRDFLRQTAVTVGSVAFPYVVRSSALGKTGAVAPSERIVMSGIGLDGQGQRNMRNFLTHSDVQWVAVCDADAGWRNQAKAIADESYGNPGTETFVNDAEANRMIARAMRSPWQI
jgi:hypothetical protein